MTELITHIDLQKQEIRAMVRGAYDIQKLRIQTGNRIVANFKVKLGIKPSEKETKAKVSKEDKSMLEVINLEYDRLTDAVVEEVPSRKTWTGKESTIISTYIELQLVRSYKDLIKTEKTQFAELEFVLDGFDIWTVFLKGVKGIGPALGGVIISELDPHAAEYASSFWKYCGLDVVQIENDKGEMIGEGRSKKKTHLVDVEYTNKDGVLDNKKSITFNPFIKTKLCGVLGPSFLKSGKDNHYAKIYYEYHKRLENSPAHSSKTKAHKYRMSIRYMIKMFLIDLYQEWRAIEGLPVNDPYHVAKLGLRDHRKAA